MMIRTITLLAFLLLLGVQAWSQQNVQGAGGKGKSGAKDKQQKTFIKPDVRAWRMTDHYTLADTVAVDTLTNGHQINNPIWRNNVANVTLGNLGSPSISAFYPTRKHIEGYMFYNVIAEFLDDMDNIVYYNTKTPYTNLAYQMGYPKRRSEEFVQVLFTQNINRRVNVGAHYKLSSSIGRYESQRADHLTFRLFNSFNGDYYSYYFTYNYNKAAIQENGGILYDDYILGSDTYTAEKPEDIPVNFVDADNNLSRYQFLFAHQLDLGHVERAETDTTTIEIPVATIYHKLHIDKTHHEFIIGDLDNYEDVFDDLLPGIYNDSTSTKDKSRYLCISNLVQLKMNEEFNTLLRFGMRLYVGNDIRHYNWPGTEMHSSYQSESRVTSYVGGQIFKNIGKNFRWNAGVRLYIQGYKSGDFVIDGNAETEFKVLGKTALIYAKGDIEMRSPELLEDKYSSNHYQWSQSLGRTKTLNIKGGIKIPDYKMEIMGFAGTLNKYIYFASDGSSAAACKPMQKNGVTQVVGLYFAKHFSVIGFNSINRIAVQKSSDNDVMPLPTFAIINSNFFEHLFFGVLTMQIGFDFRYNSRYYTPTYIPALMQFCVQNEQKIGDYPYFDPFLNFQLKRARIYLKYEHVNSLWGSQNYFHTLHYPANPNTFKFGVSWNFYD